MQVEKEYFFLNVFCVWPEKLGAGGQSDRSRTPTKPFSGEETPTKLTSSSILRNLSESVNSHKTIQKKS